MKTRKNQGKKFRKATAVTLVLLMAFAMLAGCGGGDSDVPETVSEIVNVAALNGPTGMGMVQLMDMTDKYAVETYQSPTDVTAKLIKGEVDVAALPSNMAAVLYNKTEGQVVAVSPIALGVLHILGNNVDITEVSQLEGKTIVASGQGGTPEYVLQKVVEAAGLPFTKSTELCRSLSRTLRSSPFSSTNALVATSTPIGSSCPVASFHRVFMSKTSATPSLPAASAVDTNGSGIIAIVPS